MIKLMYYCHKFCSAGFSYMSLKCFFFICKVKDGISKCFQSTNNENYVYEFVLWLIMPIYKWVRFIHFGLFYEKMSWLGKAICPIWLPWLGHTMTACRGVKMKKLHSIDYPRNTQYSARFCANRDSMFTCGMWERKIAFSTSLDHYSEPRNRIIALFDCCLE